MSDPRSDAARTARDQTNRSAHVNLVSTRASMSDPRSDAARTATESRAIHQAKPMSEANPLS